MNIHPFAIAKQLYRTSYSPAPDTSRPSSLNNSNFTPYAHPPILQVRPESTRTPLLMTKNNLGNSQAVKLDHKVKMQTSEYYNEPMKLEETVRQLQAKLEQISKRVVKNTEDIRNINASSKSELVPQASLASELDRLNKRQQTVQRDCLLKISQLKSEILAGSTKSIKFQTKQLDRMNLRFQQKLLDKIRSLIQDRVKQESLKVKLMIDNQINRISSDIESGLGQEGMKAPMKSRLKYPFKSTRITYSQFLKSGKFKEGSRVSTRQSSESPRSSKILMSNQQVYYIDKEGFLLDEDNYYLLDKDERMIRLASSMVDELRREGLLQSDC